MLLKRRLRLGGGLLALGVMALFAALPPPARGDKTGQHNLESHQYKDSRKCLLTATASGCGGVKRTAAAKRHVDKRQHSGGVGGGGAGGGGGGGGGGGARGGGGASDNNDVDQNMNFDYNNYDGGGGGGGYGEEVGQDGGPVDTVDDYYDPPLITDPRDRMMPVIYNPRPMYAPPSPPMLPPHRQQKQPQQPMAPPYNEYDEVAQISPFEVPIIECPPTEDGFERFACPTPDKEGRFRCIDDHVLCDGYIDCPNGDDEDRKNCFFFKTTKAHLDILADALLRWARGR